MKHLLHVLLFLAVAVALSAQTPPDRPVIVIVHGAWGGAWQFAKVEPLLRDQGYDVRRVTLTGLGERAHLASPDIGLTTHIDDVANVLLFEQLHNVTLIGHSYGGMVITGVADRLPERIARLVYLDAMLPVDGESATALIGTRLPLEQMTRQGMIIPTWVKADKPHPYDVPHPLKTFTDTISLNNPAREKIPAAYILTVDAGRPPEQDAFWTFAERARARGWPVTVMTADHNPQWRLPAETAELLGRLAAGTR